MALPTNNIDGLVRTDFDGLDKDTGRCAGPRHCSSDPLSERVNAAIATLAPTAIATFTGVLLAMAFFGTVWLCYTLVLRTFRWVLLAYTRV